jgi:hypothetical protein
MTYLARVCPCCEGDARTHDAYPALVSPFLATYVLDTDRPSPTRLLECDACGFRFFEDRLTAKEAERLYAGYRGDRYFAVRHRHEPWYTRKVNDAIGGDDDVVGVRRKALERFVRDHIDVSKLDDVLDYGGDRGQVLPAIGQRRFVYEISGTEPVSGVTRIGSAPELKDRRFDLVLLSHVLEHCSEPREVLGEVLPLLRSKDSVLYVELPLERHGLRWLGRKASYRAYLGALRHLGPILTAVDLYSTFFRVRYDTLPPLGFLRMHEHINFFDERSLESLFEKSGLEVVAIERLVIRSKLGAQPVLSALARKR